MEEEIDHDGTYDMICPHCGHTQRDVFEYRSDEGQAWCDRCGAEFDYCRNISVTYSTSKKETTP